MKTKYSVLHVSHISSYTPPIGYGGIELIVDLLAKYQLQEGHKVKVLGVAPPNVHIEYPIISVFDRPVKNPRFNHKLYYISKAIANSLEADIVHLHVQWLLAGVPILRLINKTTLLTLHADLKNDFIGRIAKHIGIPLIAISKTQKERLEKKGFKIFDVVYHGIEVERYPFLKKKEDFLLFLGRIDPIKGTHVAINVARKTGERLLIIGPISDHMYFETFVKPFIDDKNIVYLGEVDFNTKVKYLSQAKALLYPVQYEEFFGLVMVEALACGTPVIGLTKGSVVELVKHGVTGFTVKTEDDMVKAIRELDSIDPFTCRKYAEEKFSVGSMVEKYNEIYVELLGNAMMKSRRM